MANRVSRHLTNEGIWKLRCSLDNEPEDWSLYDNDQYLRHKTGFMQLRLKTPILYYRREWYEFKWFDRMLIRSEIRKWLKWHRTTDVREKSNEIIDILNGKAEDTVLARAEPEEIMPDTREYLETLSDKCSGSTQS